MQENVKQDVHTKSLVPASFWCQAQQAQQHSPHRPRTPTNEPAALLATKEGGEQHSVESWVS